MRLSMARVKPLSYTKALVSRDGKPLPHFQRFLEDIGVTVTALSDLTGDLDDIASGAINVAFTTTNKTKLDGIEEGATADQTGAEIKTLYESEADTNAFTDAEKTKLSGVETGATADQSNAEILAAWETASGLDDANLVLVNGSRAFTGAVQLLSTNVAGAPSAGTAGRVIYVSDGDAGSPCLAVDNGSNWLRVALGAAISAT